MKGQIGSKFNLMYEGDRLHSAASVYVRMDSCVFRYAMHSKIVTSSKHVLKLLFSQH